MAEFQYNNHIHSSTQQTPFFLDSGQHLRMGFEPQQPSWLESVNEFTDRMKLALEEAKSALAKAKDDMARYYNQRRLPTPVYKPGNLVYLDASDIKMTRPSRKLSHRRLGPFPVERRVSRNAYRLQLPFPMRRLHPVFNIVKLTTAPPDPIPGRHPQPPPPPEVIDGEDEYLVKKILDSKMFHGRLKFKILKLNGKVTGQNTTVGNMRLKSTHQNEWQTSIREIPLRQGKSEPLLFPKSRSGPCLQSTSRRSSRKRGGRCKGTLRFALHRSHASDISSGCLPTRRPLPRSS
jgi:hypothetical protein